MKVAHLSEPAEERVIFRDGLGVRERRDTGTGEFVEWCHLNPAFASVELPLRERVTRLAKLQHVKFARILALEPSRKDRGPILVSSHVPGSRLSDVLEMAGHGLVTFEPGAGLQILRDVLGALAVLHDSRNVGHGSLGPERVVLTASGRVVVVEHVLGPGLDRLQRPRHQLWREWRVPTPPSAGPVRFDMQTDLAQAGLLGLAVLLGRPIDEEEYPHRLRGLLPMVQDRLGRSPSAQIATQVVSLLERLAPLDSRRAFKTVREAQQALEGLFSGGGAALGASPARIKGVVAAVAAIAAADTPPASANEATQAAAPIIIATPRAVPASHDESAHTLAQTGIEASAPATDSEIDIAALLALEAELEGGSSPATPLPAAPPATGSALSGPHPPPDAPPDAEPVLPVALHADDGRPLGALAEERRDLERQLAELVASVAPVSADEPVPLIPATPATSEPLVDARVLWSSMPAADESETGAPIEAAAPSSEAVALLPAIQAAVPADDDARVPFADTSVFARLGLDAGTEPVPAAAEEESRPIAAIEHVSAGWWKEALPWRDERDPDEDALVAVGNEDMAVEEQTIAEHVVDIAAPDEAVVAVASDAADDLPILDLEPAGLVESSIELAAIADVVTTEEPQHDEAAEVVATMDATAVVEDDSAADVEAVADLPEVVGDASVMVIDMVADATDLADAVVDEPAEAGHDSASIVEETTAVAVAAVLDAALVAPDDIELAPVVVDTTEVADVVEVVAEIEVVADAPDGDAAPDLDVLTYHDEDIDEHAGPDLELAPPAPAETVTSFAPDVETVAVAPEEGDAGPAEAMAASAVQESCGDDVTADQSPDIEEASIADADASAPPDANIGGDNAMAPVRGYRLFGDIEPILVRTDDESATPQADSPFGDEPMDDAPSLTAASLLSRAPGGDDARDWRTSFLGATKVEDGPAPTADGFFADQPVAELHEPEAEPVIEFEPVAEAAVEMAVVDARDDDHTLPSEATTAPDATLADVEEQAPVGERIAAADADAPAQPPQESPVDTPPVESPARVDMPASTPQIVPEIVIVDDGRDGDAWDDLPSELHDVIGPRSESGVEPVPASAFGSSDQSHPSAEPVVAAHDEDHHGAPGSAAATSESGSKKKRRRARRKKHTTAVPPPSRVVSVPVTTGTPPVSVPAVLSAPSEVTPPIAVPVAAAEALAQAPHAPVVAPVGSAAIPNSLPPSDASAGTPPADATPEIVDRQASLLDRQVPAWTPPSDFDAMRRGYRPSVTQPGSAASPIHVEPLAGEHDAGTVPASTGPVGAPVPARNSVGAETAAPVTAQVSSTSSPFGTPENLRAFEPEIRAVGMPDLDEFEGRSGRTTVTMGEPIGTVTTASRSVASVEPWGATPVQPASPRGTNWKRFIAASVLIALFQGVAFAAWWWVQPGARGTLVVQTAKSGVEVLLDGKVLGRTPFRDEVAPGRHKLGLRQGTNVREMPVEISVGVVTTQALEWPSSIGGKGNLQVTSSPAGAEIVINGKVRGTTPLLLERLPAGDQLLLVRGDAGSVSVKAMVVADETTPLEVKIFAGWILVDAPVEVNLLLNGTEKIGSSMDGQILLPPGKHRLRAINDALGIRQWLAVNVEPGAVERVTLAVPPGTLTLQEEGEVSIDGAPAGTTPGSIAIPPGTHEIVVRLADGTERRQTLTVRAGQRVEF